MNYAISVSKGQTLGLHIIELKLFKIFYQTCTPRLYAFILYRFSQRLEAYSCHGTYHVCKVTVQSLRILYVQLVVSFSLFLIIFTPVLYLVFINNKIRSHICSRV